LLPKAGFGKIFMTVHCAASRIHGKSNFQGKGAEFSGMIFINNQYLTAKFPGDPAQNHTGLPLHA
jgi:hypothetical protein